ncbi:MAG: hypothetical protein WBF17_11295 [Phycisphaerae bacterium]
MFTRLHVQDGEAEYSTHCGWIDWGHAYPMREDVVNIWSQLPHRRLPGQPPLRLYRVADGQGFLVTNVALVDSVLRRLVSPSRRTFSYVVPCLGDPNHLTPAQQDFYRGAALWIYKQGCHRAEQLQEIYGGRYVNISYFSFEDLVSNLLSFYAYVMGWASGSNEGQQEENAKLEIRMRAGSPGTPSLRRQMSMAVWDGMGTTERIWGQLTRRATNWTQGYLFNDLVPRRFGPPSRQRGWTQLPTIFRSIRDVRCVRFIPHTSRGDLSPDRSRVRLASASTGIPRVRGRDIRPLGMTTE